jgi:hypothetical protein
MDIGTFQQDKCQSVMRGPKMATVHFHMVIENIFVSGFGKSDPYYIIAMLPAQHRLLSRHQNFETG